MPEKFFESPTSVIKELLKYVELIKLNFKNDKRIFIKLDDFRSLFDKCYSSLNILHLWSFQYDYFSSYPQEFNYWQSRHKRRFENSNTNSSKHFLSSIIKLIRISFWQLANIIKLCLFLLKILFHYAHLKDTSGTKHTKKSFFFHKGYKILTVPNSILGRRLFPHNIWPIMRFFFEYSLFAVP